MAKKYEQLTPDQERLRDEFFEAFPNLIVLVWKVFPEAARVMMGVKKMTYPEIESIAWAGVMRAVRMYRTPSDAVFSTYAIKAIKNEIIMEYVREKASKRNPKHGKVVHIDSAHTRGIPRSEWRAHWQMFRDDKPCSVDEVERKEREAVIRFRIRNALDELKEKRDRRVVMMRYGIPDGEPMSLAEVGKVIGLTKERIRQLEIRAFGRLRKKLEEFWKVVN